MVPEAEPLVSAFRARFAAASVARRLPAHITLLIPFVAASKLDIGQETPGVSVAEIARAAEEEIASSLPVRFRAAAARLLVELVDGAWTQEADLPFGP